MSVSYTHLDVYKRQVYGQFKNLLLVYLREICKFLALDNLQYLLNRVYPIQDSLDYYLVLLAFLCPGKSRMAWSDDCCSFLKKPNSVNIKSNYAQHLVSYDHDYTDIKSNLETTHL